MNRSPARTRAALGLSIAGLLAGLIFALAQSPPLVAHANGVRTAVEFGSVSGRFAGCQANEVLPAGTTAVRLSLDATLGPRVEARVLKGGRLLTAGQRSAGWTAADVTVPLRPLPHTATGVRLCFRFDARDESVGLIGERAATAGSSTGSGLLQVEYLKPGRRSWWSLASSVARHMAFGHAWGGLWVVVFVGVAMAAVLAVVCRLAWGLSR
jgi:hypothetical protein